MRQEERLSVNKLCQILELSRSQYYRRVFGMKDYETLAQREATEEEQKVRERSTYYAKVYPFYGHRKVHKMLEREGIKTSRYSVFKALKTQNLLLPTTWRKDIRERAKARKQYIHKPDGALKLLQLDIKQLIIFGYGKYYLVNVIDYFTKYMLVSHFADRTDGELLIEVCERALQEGESLGLEVPEEVVLAPLQFI